MRTLEPKPDVAVLDIAGRGNLPGRPFNDSAAQLAALQVRWLEESDLVLA